MRKDENHKAWLESWLNLYSRTYRECIATQLPEKEEALACESQAYQEIATLIKNRGE